MAECIARPPRPAALLLALLLAPPAAAAQDSLSVPTGTATMSGRVVDVHTGAPIAGVTVAIAALRRVSITDESGGFVMERLPEGNYTWRFSRLGYSQWEGESPIRDGDWFTVRLLPQPEVLAGLTVVADAFERRRRRVVAAVTALDEATIAASGAGSAQQLLISRSMLSVVGCGGEAFACVLHRGTLIRPAIFVDDQPFTGGLPQLAIFSTAEIHLVEVLKWAGGVRIYITTRAYAERLARRRRGPEPFLLVGGGQRAESAQPLQPAAATVRPGTAPPGKDPAPR